MMDKRETEHGSKLVVGLVNKRKPGMEFLGKRFGFVKRLERSQVMSIQRLPKDMNSIKMLI